MRPYFILSFIAIISCAYDPPLNRLEIHGYACGDSIGSDISFSYSHPEGRQIGSLISDKRVTLYLMKGYIEILNYDSLSKLEADSLANRITEIYCIKPVSIYDEHGKLAKLIWNDSISGDQFELKEKGTSYLLRYKNPITTKWIYDNLIEPQEDPEYDFTKMENE